MAAGQVDGVMQSAVDPEAHPQLVALWLDVDVGGPVAHGLGDEEIHDLNHRSVFGGDDLDRRVRGSPGGVALLEGTYVLLDVPEGPVGGVDGTLHVRLRRDDQSHDAATGIGQCLGELRVGIGDGDRDARVLDRDRHGQVGARHALRQGLDCFHRRRLLRQIDDRHEELRR